MNFKTWFKSKYADKNGNYSIVAQGAQYLTRKGWLGCRKQVLELFKHSKLNMKNNDLKFLLDEIKKL